MGAIAVWHAEIRIERNRPVVTPDGIFGAADRVQSCATVEPVARRIRVELDRAVETRQCFRVAPELAQHVGAVAIGVGEFRVAFDRVVEAFQRVLDLAHAVQCLADQVVRARLFWPERK